MDEGHDEIRQVEEGAAGETETQVASEPETPDEAGLVRDLILRAYPDVVPELIGGETVAEMLAAVPAAQEAYRRVVETAGESRTVAPEPVPAGAGSRSAPRNVDALPPVAKIRAGLGYGT